MTRILVLYYSSYGHTAKMAAAAAEGVRAGGAEATIMRAPETAPREVVEAFGFQEDETHATVQDPNVLADFDGIIVGTPTRYGRMSSQMAALWDQTGGLWKEGKLVGKVGACFVSSASQHGGQETTAFSVLTNLLHMGMTIVGLDYGFNGQMGTETAHGGSPYGASTIAGTDGRKQPADVDLDGARYLGKKVAQTAAKLSA